MQPAGREPVRMGRQTEKLERKRGFLSKAKRKKHNGLKGRNLLFAWEE